jgi:hypothetical protein
VPQVIDAAAPLSAPGLWLTGIERAVMLASLAVALGGLAGCGLARHYKAALVLAAGAAALFTLSGCNGSSSVSSSGPLPHAPGVGICWGPERGSVLSATMYGAQNNASSPVTLTGASFISTRDVTVDGVYADVIPEHDAFGALYGPLPASYRNPVKGTTIPPGDGIEVIFMITARTAAALAAGERVTYTYQGQSYVTTGAGFAGMKPSC